MRIKETHEQRCVGSQFKVSEAFLEALEAEMVAYWSELRLANRNDHIVPELAVPVPPVAVASQQFDLLYRVLEQLSETLADLAKWDRALNDEIRLHLVAIGYDVTAYDAVPYHANPFANRNWETHSLRVSNIHTELTVALVQSELRFLEEYAKTHSSDIQALQRLEAVKIELREMAVSAGYAD